MGPGFGRHRAWLGELCRIAARLLEEAYAAGLPGARPGLVRFVQTFGDLANFNPHVHVLPTDGAFRADGSVNVCFPERDGQQRVVSSLSLRSKADAGWNVC